MCALVRNDSGESPRTIRDEPGMRSLLLLGTARFDSAEEDFRKIVTGRIVIARSGSDVAIRILYAGSVFLGAEKEGRIATPVCALVRNDKEGGRYRAARVGFFCHCEERKRRGNPHPVCRERFLRTVKRETDCHTSVRTGSQ